MNIFLIGMGNMGIKHLDSIFKLKKKYNLNFVGFYDPKINKINYGKKIFFSEKKLTKTFITNLKIDLCIISTPHNHVKKYFKKFVNTPKSTNLFIEKPFGLNLKEANFIYKNKKKNQKIFLGLNYRYYKGISRMHSDFKNGFFGKVSSICLSMHHGHSPSIINSWKIKKKMAGGGVIIDPGIHLINLASLFFGKNIKILNTYVVKNFFWKTGIEEEASILMRTEKIPLIKINLSIVRWRSQFSIEINGLKNYGKLIGRGSHYGPQIYSRGERWAWIKTKHKNQARTEKIIVKSDEKKSFLDEMEAVVRNLKNKKNKIEPCESLEALNTMTLVDKIYKCTQRKS
jgi:predicted dehydrogenase